MTTTEHSTPGRGDGPAAGGGRSPELAVLLVTDTLQTIRKTLAHFRAQTVRDRIQVVVASPPGSGVVADAPDLAGFADVRLVEIGRTNVRKARAAALRAATAPIVVIGETHAYPRPDYAEKLIEAHDGPWAAVGPSVDNANPATLTSWVELFMSYGAWVEPARGVADDVPGHNSAYKRELLLGLGDGVDEVVGHGTSLHPELLARGHRLFVEPAARVDHLNPSIWTAYFALTFQAGRLYAVLRAREWSRSRRALYVAGSPLIPAVRLWRIARHMLRSPRGRRLLIPLVPCLVPMLVANAIGEATGYVFGLGSVHILDRAELHRTDFVRADERTREADERTWPATHDIPATAAGSASPAGSD